MGRQSGEPTVVGSSITLLQERFRQLQRARKKRERRELLKLFLESKQVTPTIQSEPPKLFSQPEMVSPSTPPLQGLLSLGFDSQRKHADFRSTETPPLINLWSTDAAALSTSQNFENSEVDTSLHL